MSNQTTWTDDAGGIFNANKTTPLPVDTGVLPAGATYVATSSTGAATAIGGTVLSAVGKRAYLAGIVITGAGATAASVITAAVTNTTPSLSFKIVIPAGATTSIQPLIVNFNPPIPANALNTGINVNLPSFGAGNTDAACVAWGYYV